MVSSIFSEIYDFMTPPCSYDRFHSQTFENKSSLAANPVAGLAPVAGVGCVALLHPPKSSSVLTLGGGLLAVLKPPLPPGTILWFVRELLFPHPKSLALVCIGGAVFAIEGPIVDGAASGVLQASLEPHASLFDHPLVVAAGTFC